MSGIPSALRDPEIRFWSKVDKGAKNGCWQWTASLSKGYGQFRVGDRIQMAHIWSWERSSGGVPAGLELDHLCRNRACVNPDHLEPVTRATNLSRGIHHYRVRSRCKHGHDYTPENTYIYQGARLCRACRRASQKNN